MGPAWVSPVSVAMMDKKDYIISTIISTRKYI